MEDNSDHLESRDVLLRVYCIGDWGRPCPTLAASMSRFGAIHGNPDCILGLGDNFYPNGVESVEDSQFNTCWKEVYLKHENLCCPWYLILGRVYFYMQSPTLTSNVRKP